MRTSRRPKWDSIRFSATRPLETRLHPRWVICNVPWSWILGFSNWRIKVPNAFGVTIALSVHHLALRVSAKGSGTRNGYEWKQFTVAPLSAQVRWSLNGNIVVLPTPAPGIPGFSFSELLFFFFMHTTGIAEHWIDLESISRKFCGSVLFSFSGLR